MLLALIVICGACWFLLGMNTVRTDISVMYCRGGAPRLTICQGQTVPCLDTSNNARDAISRGVAQDHLHVETDELAGHVGRVAVVTRSVSKCSLLL